MDIALKDKLPISHYFFFVGDLHRLTTEEAYHYIIHIFVHKGWLRFQMYQQEYEANPMAYVILIDPSLASQIHWSDDISASVIFLSKDTPKSNVADNGFNVIAMPFLLLDPVLPLSPADYELCAEDILMLQKRATLTEHNAYRDMMLSLLEVHIFNLHDLIMRRLKQRHVSDRSERLMVDFITMLTRGDYREHRDLHYYASQLFVADNYLTQVCRNVSTHSATYWINLFTASEIARLLKNGDTPFAEIAELFHFSSISYFSRYVSRHLGATPSEIRKRGKKL